ncbi:MAG: proton-conducting transporter transmembrane domain-containing protein, partial [Allosphingosinicella sp.]
MTIAAFLSGIAALLALSIAAIPLARRPAGSTILYGSALALSMLLLGGAITHLVSGADPVWIRSPLGLPWIGSRFRLDALSTFFLAVANLGGSVACLYATGGGAKESEPQRVLPFFPAFLAAMNLVVLADDAFTFLLSWEFMSLTSWALVMAHHRERGNAHAGYVYIVMATFGTLALLLAFGLLAGPGGGYDFAAMRAHEVTPAIAGLVLALVLLGAGSKAGIVPLHVWLPLAHPAAPSHVSALMSGVMTKVAIYGFVRIVFDLLDEPS